MLPPQDIGDKLTIRDRKDDEQIRSTLKRLMDKKSKNVDITAALMGGQTVLRKNEDIAANMMEKIKKSDEYFDKKRNHQ